MDELIELFEGRFATGERAIGIDDLLVVVVMMMMIIFNGRRPVPITRVLNIPCWDKSRQVVRPGLQYLYT